MSLYIFIICHFHLFEFCDDCIELFLDFIAMLLQATIMKLLRQHTLKLKNSISVLSNTQVAVKRTFQRVLVFVHTATPTSTAAAAATAQHITQRVENVAYHSCVAAYVGSSVCVAKEFLKDKHRDRFAERGACANDICADGDNLCLQEKPHSIGALVLQQRTEHPQACQAQVFVWAVILRDLQEGKQVQVDAGLQQQRACL